MKKYLIFFVAVLFTATLSAQNVGINTNTPQATLDVNGSLKVGTLVGADTQMVATDPAGNVFTRPLSVPLLQDGDGDTQIQVEENADEDIIRFDVVGSEFAIMNGKTLQLFPNVGTHNTFIGREAGQATTGSTNTFIGSRAGVSNTSGELNTMLGWDAGFFNTTGSDNVFIGRQAGVGNSTKSRNVYIGSRAGRFSPGGGSIMIGFEAGINEADSNRLYIENSGSSSPLIYGEFDNDKLAIGTSTVATDATLMVNGGIRVADDADLFGVDQIVGFNDLRLYGDATGGPDLTIAANGSVSIPEYAGVGITFGNVSLNVRSVANTVANDEIFQVENSTGLDLFGVQNDQDVFVTGNFSVAGTKNFILDHPLDPANKSLVHNAVEAPGYTTYYNGLAVMDVNGTAIVQLPDYFDALNSQPLYQLTCVGGFAQVYVAEEIADNQFKIAGGTPGLKVSWQVTAQRNDPWAQDHPYEAELEKTGSEKGRYWYPQGYGQSIMRHIGHDEQEQTDR